MLPINWLAVLVAAIIRMAVGFAWYSPPLFLKPWQASTGITPETMRAGLGKAMVVDIIASLIMAFALGNIIVGANITDWLNGALAGFWVWLGFMATLMVSLWGYENRSLKLIAINLGNNLIALILMGALLAVWR
ncbi:MULTISPECIES: DUF1761 domain-containing protein [unclassified Devosia]|jgi:hypothetical protein|uniref:DUF1761 domain-containing protein n=1 Tax=unclassified Devosia TaxID=196773 RepID=UPI000869520C|nr:MULTISPECIES: DUF1761 domain-containing protein [unclassified Devosia]MBN9360583.1 DUF1761 domain-containing protein [Devosia sp.]ODS85447.1 MAG: hypothetical protein ABS47_16770 [Devosia sp. SCN 66-27]OJX22568.1 MAG: hypothetical protein BGO83_17320 [Devosia sp. 66-14]